MTSIQTVAVTGASGHLGTGIVLEALARGLSVRAGYASYKPDITHENLVWVQGGLEPESLQALIAGAQAVVHSAAKISVHEDTDGSVMRTNVDGTQHVIDVCLANGVQRLVHLSSATVVEEYPHNQPFDETRPFKGADTSAYEYSKVLSEQLITKEVKARGLNAIIVRPSGMFGPPDLRDAIVGSMLKDMYMGVPPMLLSGGYDFVDMRDVAAGIINGLTQGRAGEAYLMTGNYLSLKVICNHFHKHGGAKPPFTIPVSLLLMLYPLVELYYKITGRDSAFTKEGLRTFKDGHPQMSSQKAMDELGYKPRPIEQSVAEMVAWWKETGRL